MNNKFETAFIYAMAAIDIIKRLYMKLFPPAAVIFVFVYVIGLAGSSDRGMLTKSTFTTTIIVALIFTVLTLLYFIGELKEGRRK